MAEVLGAFGEEAAARLTNVSVGQLRAWDKAGFFLPSFAAGNRRQPYSRVYSFRDLVALRVLNALRNEHGVSLQHLKAVASELSHMGEDKWTAKTLYVLGRRVVMEEELGKKREIVGGQHVLDIPLKIAISDTKKAIQKLNQRGLDKAGHVARGKFTMNNRAVFEGTRVLVSAVEAYIEAGFSDAEILREYPDLRLEDIKSVRVTRGRDAA